MNTYASPLHIVISPLRSARALPASVQVRQAALLVLGAGLFMAAGNFVSYLNHAYPPAPDVLKLYVDTWGEYLMLPFLKIPPESYRLFQALIALPLVYAIWMLMAGTAKLLSLLMGGRASYEQYLVITAFSFFPLLDISRILDMIFSGVIDGHVLQALTGQYGPSLGPSGRTFQTFHTVLYGLEEYGSVSAQQGWNRSSGGKPFQSHCSALVGQCC
jgi:hypothetical protein